MKILLNTAIRRLMSRMFAMRRYIDITIGVIHRPGWHGSIPGSSPHGGSILSANTYINIMNLYKCIILTLSFKFIFCYKIVYFHKVIIILCFPMICKLQYILNVHQIVVCLYIQCYFV